MVSLVEFEEVLGVSAKPDPEFRNTTSTRFLHFDPGIDLQIVCIPLISQKCPKMCVSVTCDTETTLGGSLWLIATILKNFYGSSNATIKCSY